MGVADLPGGQGGAGVDQGAEQQAGGVLDPDQAFLSPVGAGFEDPVLVDPRGRVRDRDQQLGLPCVQPGDLGLHLHQPVQRGLRIHGPNLGSGADIADQRKPLVRNGFLGWK
jgi:hypothetical protein